MSWGIVYPPYSILNMGGNPPPQTRWVYNFNGVDSYISTDIPLQNGDSIEFDFIASTSVGQGGSLLGRDSGLRLLWITDSARTINISSTASSATLDGNTIISGVTPWPDDNLVHVISISIVFSTNLTALGASGGGVGNFASLAIYNLKINDGSVYNYPINDRTFGAGAPIANTGTGPDATGVNLLESGWEEIPL